MDAPVTPSQAARRGLQVPARSTPGSANQQLQLTIITPSDPLFITVSGETSVEELKRSIARQTQISRHDQRLVLAGKQLIDGFTLAESGVTKSNNQLVLYLAANSPFYSKISLAPTIAHGQTLSSGGDGLPVERKLDFDGASQNVPVRVDATGAINSAAAPAGSPKLAWIRSCLSHRAKAGFQMLFCVAQLVVLLVGVPQLQNLAHATCSGNVREWSAVAAYVVFALLTLVTFTSASFHWRLAPFVLRRSPAVQPIATELPRREKSPAPLAAGSSAQLLASAHGVASPTHATVARAASRAGAHSSLQQREMSLSPHSAAPVRGGRGAARMGARGGRSAIVSSHRAVVTASGRGNDGEQDGEPGEADAEEERTFTRTQQPAGGANFAQPGDGAEAAGEQERVALRKPAATANPHSMLMCSRDISDLSLIVVAGVLVTWLLALVLSGLALGTWSCDTQSVMTYFRFVAALNIIQLALFPVYVRFAYPSARVSAEQALSAAGKRTARLAGNTRDRADSLSQQASRSHTPVTSRGGRDAATAAEQLQQHEQNEHAEPSSQRGNNNAATDSDDANAANNSNAVNVPHLVVDVRAAAATGGGEGEGAGEPDSPPAQQHDGHAQQQQQQQQAQHSPHVQRSASPSHGSGGGGGGSPRSRAGAGGEDLDAGVHVHETDEQRRWKRLVARAHSVSALGGDPLPALV